MDEKNKRLAAALGDDYEAKRILAELLRERKDLVAELECSRAREEVLEEELADLYEELFRLQDKTRWGTGVREETIDLSDYCERNSEEDKKQQKLSSMGAEKHRQLELPAHAAKRF